MSHPYSYINHEGYFKFIEELKTWLAENQPDWKIVAHDRDPLLIVTITLRSGDKRKFIRCNGWASGASHLLWEIAEEF